VSNIGHIGSGKWRPNFVAIWAKFLRSSGIVLMAAFIVAQIASLTQQIASLTQQHSVVVVVWVWIVAICTVLGFLVQAIHASSTLPQFLLSVESGNSRSIITSSDRDKIRGLAADLVAVINNPRHEFRQIVQNVHYGDNISQIGNHNIGKILG
jgi:hypothetical protein